MENLRNLLEYWPVSCIENRTWNLDKINFPKLPRRTVTAIASIAGQSPAFCELRSKNINFCLNYIFCTMCIWMALFRHPDATSNAYKIFFGLAMVIILQVFGIFKQSTLFWVILTGIYCYVVWNLSFILYYYGEWKRPWEQFSNFSFQKTVSIFIC